MPQTQCPSDHELQAFQLGDLPEPSLEGVAKHLESCTKCESRAEKLDTVQDPLLVVLKELSGIEVQPTAALRSAPENDATQAPGELQPYPFLASAEQADELGRLG